MPLLWFPNILRRDPTKLLEPVRMFLFQCRALLEEERKLLFEAIVSPTVRRMICADSYLRRCYTLLKTIE